MVIKLNLSSQRNRLNIDSVAEICRRNCADHWKPGDCGNKERKRVGGGEERKIAFTIIKWKLVKLTVRGYTEKP